MNDILANPLIQALMLMLVGLSIYLGRRTFGQLGKPDTAIRRSKKVKPMKPNVKKMGWAVLDALFTPGSQQPSRLFTDLLPELQATQQPQPPQKPASSVAVAPAVPSQPVRVASGTNWTAAPRKAPRIKLSDIAKADNIAVIGQKGSGKTTVLLTLMAIRDGEHIVVDPHNAPGKWPAAHVVGGGRDYGAIKNALLNLDAALNQRYGELNRGEVLEGQFPRRTLVTDEFRSIATNIPTSRDERGAGDYLLDRIAEGRKVGECALLAAHNDTVDALGIRGNADMKTCFDFIIYTGGLAVKRYQARESVTGEMLDELRREERPFVVWKTDTDEWFVLDYDLAPVTQVSSISSVVPGGSQEPVPVETVKIAGSGLGNQYGTSTEPVPGTDGIDAEVIKTLHSAGWSNNRIAAKMKGRREDRLARIREALGETVDLAA